MPRIDTGDTVWLLASAALVMFMTPGLAFFYGGLVRAKNVLGTVMQSFIALGLVSVLWALIGYTLAFGPDKGGIIGGLDLIGLNHAGVTVAFSFVATLVLLKLTDVTLGLRLSDEHEDAGLDLSQHGEVAYRIGEG